MTTIRHHQRTVATEAVVPDHLLEGMAVAGDEAALVAAPRAEARREEALPTMAMMTTHMTTSTSLVVANIVSGNVLPLIFETMKTLSKSCNMGTTPRRCTCPISSTKSGRQLGRVLDTTRATAGYKKYKEFDAYPTV